MSFDAEVCRRLPLADATLNLLDYVADDAFLADLFDRHRGRCYERGTGSSALATWWTRPWPAHGQAARRTFVRARADGALGASVKAAYDKVARLPPAVSVTLVTDGTARL